MGQVWLARNEAGAHCALRYSICDRIGGAVRSGLLIARSAQWLDWRIRASYKCTILDAPQRRALRGHGICIWLSLKSVHARCLGLAASLDAPRWLLGGLGHAHSRELIHRDLKPGNVIVMPDGRVQVPLNWQILELHWPRQRR